jgi:AraC family transcriptional regulator
VALFKFGLPPAPELTEVTALARGHNALIFHVAGPVTLQRKFETYAKKEPSVPGALNLHPAQTPGAYAWDAAATIAFVIPSATFMVQLAADLIRQNADTIGLRDDFNFQDGLLKHLCLNLLGEAHSAGLHGRVYAESLAHTLVLHLLGNYSTATRFRSLRTQL